MKRLGVVVGVLVVALVGVARRSRRRSTSRDPLVIVHWANSHPMREGLLPEMAEQFNDEDHETADGRPDRDRGRHVRLVRPGGGPRRACRRATPPMHECQDDSDEPADDPTIVTPQSDDWLVDVNHQRRAATSSISTPTAEHRRDVAGHRHLPRRWPSASGWPGRASSATPRSSSCARTEGLGARYPDCARRADWGTQPDCSSFTNPNTSTSGRNVLVSLYSMCAGQARRTSSRWPTSRTRRSCSEVEDFQGLVDHYMPGTILAEHEDRPGPELRRTSS